MSDSGEEVQYRRKSHGDVRTRSQGTVPVQHQQRQHQYRSSGQGQASSYYVTAMDGNYYIADPHSYEQQYHMQQQQHYMQMMQQHLYHHQGGNVAYMNVSPESVVSMMCAHDMDELRQFVLQVEPGYVKRVIEQALFVPRQMAFTSLMQMAGKLKQADKAVAIFEAMKDLSQSLDIKPNTFSYTALISALARVGEWRQAEEYFAEMKHKSVDDEEVRPNRVTFSSMISVYEKANKFDMAIETFEEQIAAGIEPDLITYASVLNACIRSGNLAMVLKMLESMHSQGIVGPQQLYHNILAACTKEWEFALEVFLGMQCVGVDVTSTTLNMVMKSLCLGGRKDHALWLMEQARMAQMGLNYASHDHLLGLCSDCGDYRSADAVYASMVDAGMSISAHSAGLLLSAHMQGGDDVSHIEELNTKFEAQGIMPVLPVKQEVVEHDASPAIQTADENMIMIATNIIRHQENRASMEKALEKAIVNGTTFVNDCQNSVANLSLDSVQSEVDISSMH